MDETTWTVNHRYLFLWCLGTAQFLLLAVNRCYLVQYVWIPRNYTTIIIYPYVLNIWFDLLCLTPLSAIFQLYHGDQFYWWKKPEYPERTTDHGQATGKRYHLRLRVECTLFVIYKAGREPTRIGDRLIWVVM
jgi:hypothetical protein